MLEEVLEDLGNLTMVHTEAEHQMEDEEFIEFLRKFVHPDAEKIQQKVPGFYVMFFAEFGKYGLLPINS